MGEGGDPNWDGGGGGGCRAWEMSNVMEWWHDGHDVYWNIHQARLDALSNAFLAT